MRSLCSTHFLGFTLHSYKVHEEFFRQQHALKCSLFLLLRIEDIFNHFPIGLIINPAIITLMVGSRATRCSCYCTVHVVKRELRFDLSKPLHLHLFQDSLHDKKVFCIFLSLQEIGLAFLCRKSVKCCYWLWNPMFSQRKYWERKECVLCLNTWHLGAGYLYSCSSLTRFSWLSLCLNYILWQKMVMQTDRLWILKATLFILEYLIIWLNLNCIFRLHYLNISLMKLNEKNGRIKHFIFKPLSMVVKGRMNAAYKDSFLQAQHRVAQI